MNTMTLKQLLTAVVTTLTFASSASAQDYWRFTPGSEWKNGNQNCFVETNTGTAIRLGTKTLWEERSVCIGGGKPKEFGKPFTGVAVCSTQNILADDGFSDPKWVSFDEARNDPHAWGMGNYGWGLACGSTGGFN